MEPNEREMNAYEERKAARIERYRDRAKTANQQASALFNRARQMADAIPLGQPILVGHHSETRDRNYRARIDRIFRAAFAADGKAAHYAGKAAAADANDAISSDDPEAISKIDVRIAALEAERERIKTYNASCRKGAPDFSLLDEAQRAAYAGLVRTGSQFPAYHLTNMGGNIRRLRERRAYLAAQQQAAPKAATTFGSITITEDVEDNRLRIIFPGKPGPEIIGMLKSRGFRWSPSNTAWQRQISNQARWLAEEIAKAAQ